MPNSSSCNSTAAAGGSNAFTDDDSEGDDDTNRFFRASKLILEIMGRYLRELFILSWNERYIGLGLEYEWDDNDNDDHLRSLRAKYLIEGVEKKKLIPGVSAVFKRDKATGGARVSGNMNDFMVEFFADPDVDTDTSIGGVSGMTKFVISDKMFSDGARIYIESLNKSTEEIVGQTFEVVSVKTIDPLPANAPKPKAPLPSHTLKLRFGKTDRKVAELCSNVEKIVAGSKVYVCRDSAFHSLDVHIEANLRKGRAADFDITSLNAIMLLSAHQLLPPDDMVGRQCIANIKHQRNENYAHLSSCKMDAKAFADCVEECCGFVEHFFYHRTREFERELDKLEKITVTSRNPIWDLIAVHGDGLSEFLRLGMVQQSNVDAGMDGVAAGVQSNEELCLHLQRMLLDVGGEQRLENRLAKIAHIPSREVAKLQCYVPLNGDTVRRSDNHLDSAAAALAFIDSGTNEGATRPFVMAIFADSGGGKTTFLKYLWRLLVERYHSESTCINGDVPSQQLVVPIFLTLPHIATDRLKSVLADELGHRGLTDTDINEMATKGKQIVFLLDGYDELNISGGGVNIIDSSGVGVRWSNVKVIISCREDVLKEDPKYFFAPLDDRQPQAAALLEWHLHGFGSEQLDLYLQQYVAHMDSRSVCGDGAVADRAKKWGSWTDYRDTINHNVPLKNLITTPFSVLMVVEVLPSITSRSISAGAGTLTVKVNSGVNRLVLYQEFVKVWVDRELSRARGMGVYDESLRTEVIDVCKLFALELRKRPEAQGVLCFRRLTAVSRFKSKFKSKPKAAGNASANVYLGLEYDDSLHAVFTSGKLQDETLVACCPIRPVRSDMSSGESWLSFVHRSLYEYFVYRIGAEVLEEGDFEDLVEELSNNILWQTEPSVLRFWADDARTNFLLQKYLFEIIDLSKSDQPGESVSIAAANALSILNVACVSFAGRDFSNVCVRGAYMALGNFSQADFRGADLSACNLNRAYLSGANFTECVCEDVEFGESPSIETNYVGSVCVSADDQLLALGAFSVIEIWDLSASASTSLVRKLHGHERDVTALAMTMSQSPRQSQCVLISGGIDESIRVWSMSSWECIRVLTDHTKGVRSLATKLTLCDDAGSGYLFSASNDATVRVWDLEAYACVHVIDIDVYEDHGCNAAMVKASPDGRLLVVSSGYQASVWDLTTCSSPIRAGTLEHEAFMWVRSVSISPDSQLIVTGVDRGVNVWDSRTHTRLNVLKEPSSVSSLCFSPDGRRLYTGSLDHLVRVWDMQTLVCIEALEGHSDEVSVLCTDNKASCLISGGGNNSIRRWTTDRMLSVHDLEGPTAYVHCVCVSADAKYIFTGGRDNVIRVWDIGQSSGAGAGAAVRVLPEGRLVSALCMPPETAGCHRLYSGSTIGSAIHAWDVSSGCRIHVLDERSDMKFLPGAEHTRCMCFSREGNHLCVGSGKALDTKFGRIILWNLQTHSIDRTVTLDSGPVNSIAINSDGGSMLSTNERGAVYVWNLHTWECMEELDGEYSCAEGAVSVSPRSTRLVTVGSRLKSGGSVILWDRETKLQHLMQHSNGCISCVCLSLDGDLLFASCKNTVRVWDISTLELVGVLEGNVGTITAMCAAGADSGSCSYLIAVSRDSSVFCWDLATAALRFRLGPPQLRALGLNICRCIGLSAQNAELLMQLGATDNEGEEEVADDGEEKEVITSPNALMVEPGSKSESESDLSYSTIVAKLPGGVPYLPKQIPGNSSAHFLKATNTESVRNTSDDDGDQAFIDAMFKGMEDLFERFDDDDDDDV